MTRSRNESLIHPRYWPTWIGIALLRALVLLPLPILWWIGGALGMLFYAVHFPRRRIAHINIDLCFPEWSARARRQLVRRHFRALGRGLFDIGIAWWASRRRLQRLVHVRNGEHYQALRAGGRGFIVLTPHFVAQEVGGIFLSLEQRGVALFKDTRNAVVNYLYRRYRQRFHGTVFEYAQGLKPIVRTIRAGQAFYYLPDQDLGRKLSIFVPFFGVSTATVPALSKLSRLSDAPVVPCITVQRRFGTGYDLVFASPLSNFPSDDIERDTVRMNQAIEQTVLLAPAQYFWVHKRFKTRPPGEPRVY